MKIYRKAKGCPGARQVLPGASRFTHFGIKSTLASQGFEHLLCCRFGETLSPTNKNHCPGVGRSSALVELGSSIPGLETLCECPKGLSSDLGLRDTGPEPARESRKRRKR